MGTYCEEHLVRAIDKYMEASEDGVVFVESSKGDCPCSDIACDNEGLYMVSYKPKTEANARGYS